MHPCSLIMLSEFSVTMGKYRQWDFKLSKNWGNLCKCMHETTDLKVGSGWLPSERILERKGQSCIVRFQRE